MQITDKRLTEFHTKYNILANGCWQWNGSKHSSAENSYGNFTASFKVIMQAHKFSWLIHKGPITEHAYIYHRCKNKGCVNPDHLYEMKRGKRQIIAELSNQFSMTEKELQNLYSIWKAMLGRCTNSNDKDFARYGGRGITICENWLDFANFVKDMGLRPSKLYSIDRVDNDKGYNKENCRWATLIEQAFNKSTTVKVMFNDQQLSLKEACRLSGISYHTARSRIKAGKPWDYKREIKDEQ
jgi:hypothetical protein